MVALCWLLQGALGLLAVPSAALIPLGLTIYDPRTLHNPITKKKVMMVTFSDFHCYYISYWRRSKL